MSIPVDPDPGKGIQPTTQQAYLDGPAGFVPKEVPLTFGHSGGSETMLKA
jgi:hypothetical protein